MKQLLRLAPCGALALLLLAAGCGSTQPQPVAAPPAAPPPPAPPPPPTPVASATPAPAPEPTAAPAPVAETPPSRSQKPIDMLTARDAAFLLDYANSEVKQRAKDQCDRESKGDPDKLGACLEKARDAFQADVIRFKRDQDNKRDWEKSVKLFIYKRNGSALREVAVGTVQLAEEGTDGVKVTIGKLKGSRPLFRNQTNVVIRAPNEYSIEINDPDYGRLAYDAKIGLVTD
ncbi:MAG TPA: hypothetical protein VNN72_02985 [Polyangiaceae bacterium]|nr:hypothetical protein [Polyangiaceae bacterium]